MNTSWVRVSLVVLLLLMVSGLLYGIHSFTSLSTSPPSLSDASLDDVTDEQDESSSELFESEDVDSSTSE